MIRKLTAIALVATAGATLAAVAAAGPVATKQRVEIISAKGGTSFVLAPLTPGAIKRDTGVASFCCWTQRFVTRDGQRIEIDNPQMTLTSVRGALVVRNQIGFVDVPDGWAVFTGTWKVIRGSGAYAGLSGGGYGGGVQLADGTTKSRFEGFLGAK